MSMKDTNEQWSLSPFNPCAGLFCWIKCSILWTQAWTETKYLHYSWAHVDAALKPFLSPFKDLRPELCGHYVYNWCFKCRTLCPGWAAHLLSSKDSGKIPGISTPGFQKGRQAPEDSQGGDATQHWWLWCNRSCLGQLIRPCSPWPCNWEPPFPKGMLTAGDWSTSQASSAVPRAADPTPGWPTRGHTPAPQWVVKTKIPTVG